MILEYDNNPNLTPEQRLHSLKEKVQLALDEQSTHSDALYRSLLSALGVNITSIRNDFTSLSERLETEAQALASAVADVLERLETVEEATTQLDVIQESIGTLEGNIKTISDTQSQMQKQISGITTSIGTLSKNYTDLEKRVKKLEG